MGSSGNGWARWQKILGVGVLAATLLGMSVPGGRWVASNIFGLATRAEVAEIKAMLVCAMWQVPAGCKDAFAREILGGGRGAVQ